MRNISTRLNGALWRLTVALFRNVAQMPLFWPNPWASRAKPRISAVPPATSPASRRAGRVVVRFTTQFGDAPVRMARAYSISLAAALRQSLSISAIRRAPGRGQARSTWRIRGRALEKLSRHTRCTRLPCRCRSSIRGWHCNRSPNRVRLMTTVQPALFCGLLWALPGCASSPAGLVVSMGQQSYASEEFLPPFSMFRARAFSCLKRLATAA